jgi:hypothetical protein
MLVLTRMLDPHNCLLVGVVSPNFFFKKQDSDDVLFDCVPIPVIVIAE